MPTSKVCGASDNIPRNRRDSNQTEQSQRKEFPDSACHFKNSCHALQNCTFPLGPDGSSAMQPSASVKLLLLPISLPEQAYQDARRHGAASRWSCSRCSRTAQIGNRSSSLTGTAATDGFNPNRTSCGRSTARLACSSKRDGICQRSTMQRSATPHCWPAHSR